MTLNRRQFVILGAGLLAGCAVAGTGADKRTISPGTGGRTFDAGPAGAFRDEGVYDRFRYQGFFLVRRDGLLFALSSICTHRRCTLNLAPDGSFICPCHGSTFDPEGAVTRGPAQRDLPRLPLRVDGRGRVLVQD